MSTAAFKTFLEKLGHKVRFAGGMYWFNRHPGVYFGFPYHVLIDPAQIPVSEVLGRDGLMLRCACPVELGVPSYTLICTDPNYGFASLSQKTRNQVRQGLNQCEVRRVEFAELQKEGMEIHRETYQRQGRKFTRRLERYWRDYFRYGAESEALQAWGAYVGGTLAAFIMAVRMDDHIYIPVVRSRPDYLRYRPNNALHYTFIHHALHEQQAASVSIGWQALQSGTEQLEAYKLGIGFKRQPIGQRIEIRPSLKRLLSPRLVRASIGLLDRFPEHEKLNKVRGALSFFVQQLPRSS